VKFSGDICPTRLSAEGIGYSCKKGLKPGLPNQDSFFCMKLEGVFALYGVFDGHGQDGHLVSDFVQEMLPKVLLKHDCLLNMTPVALQASFAETQDLIQQAHAAGHFDASNSGTTATVVFHNIQMNLMFIAHVGDSRCVLAKTVEASPTHADDDASVSAASPVFQAVNITEDHKPQLPEEQARIINGGGQVRWDGCWNYRVYIEGKRYPGLNMSRSLGDLSAHQNAGLSTEPAICVCNLIPSPTEKGQGDSSESSMVSWQRRGPDAAAAAASSSCNPDVSSESARGASAERSMSLQSGSRIFDVSEDRLLLICTDGVWEVMKPQEAMDKIAGTAINDPHSAADRLTTTAWDLWVTKMRGQAVDDITAVLIPLQAIELKTAKRGEEFVDSGQ